MKDMQDRGVRKCCSAGGDPVWLVWMLSCRMTHEEGKYGVNLASF